MDLKKTEQENLKLYYKKLDEAFTEYVNWPLVVKNMQDRYNFKFNNYREDVIGFNGKYFLFQLSNSNYVFVRSDGYIMSPTFSKAYPFNDGYAMVRDLDSNDFVYIDEYFNKIEPLPKRNFEYSNFIEGKAKILDKKTNKYFFLDKNLTYNLNFEFADADDFSEGRAPVKIGDKWGYIDYNYHTVIEPIYDEVKSFFHGFSGVKKDNKWSYIDSEGKNFVDFSSNVETHEFPLIELKNIEGKSKYTLFNYSKYLEKLKQNQDNFNSNNTIGISFDNNDLESFLKNFYSHTLYDFKPTVYDYNSKDKFIVKKEDNTFIVVNNEDNEIGLFGKLAHYDFKKIYPIKQGQNSTIAEIKSPASQKFENLIILNEDVNQVAPQKIFNYVTDFFNSYAYFGLSMNGKLAINSIVRKNDSYHSLLGKKETFLAYPSNLINSFNMVERKTINPLNPKSVGFTYLSDFENKYITVPLRPLYDFKEISILAELKSADNYDFYVYDKKTKTCNFLVNGKYSLKDDELSYNGFKIADNYYLVNGHDVINVYQYNLKNKVIANPSKITTYNNFITGLPNYKEINEYKSMINNREEADKLSEKIIQEKTLSELVLKDKEKLVANALKQLLEETKNLNRFKNTKKDRDDITAEMLFEKVADHLEVKNEFKNILSFLDLSLIDFSNVKIADLDFSYSNANINPQTVYQKDMSHGNYSGLNFDFKSFNGVNISDSIFDSYYINIDGAVKNEKTIINHSNLKR